jgi:hypothetical protein
MWHRVEVVLTDVSEDCFLHSHRRENLKSYRAAFSFHSQFAFISQQMLFSDELSFNVEIFL